MEPHAAFGIALKCIGTAGYATLRCALRVKLRKARQFKKLLLAQMHESFGAHHGGEEREESCEARAERLLEFELKRLGWTQEQLANRRKGDARKARVAQRLREETAMTLAWIAQRLSMGSTSTVAQSLRRNY